MGTFRNSKNSRMRNDREFRKSQTIETALVMEITKLSAADTPFIRRKIAVPK